MLQADINNDGTLTFNELWQLLKSLEIELSEAHCRKMFQVRIITDMIASLI